MTGPLCKECGACAPKHRPYCQECDDDFQSYLDELRADERRENKLMEGSQ